MSGSQRALQVISVVTIVLAVLGLVTSVMLVAGGSVFSAAVVVDPAIDGGDLAIASSVFLLIAGVTGIVSSVVDLVVGILGLRGAKDPSKIMPFFVLAIIGLVLVCIGTVAGIVGGDLQISLLIEVVVMAVCVALAYQIKGQREA